jgi:DNA-binding response OmpR family regulator
MNAPHQAVTILLVEDDDGHRLLIRESLRAAGIINELVEVGDGQQALDYLARCEPNGCGAARPGLILLDIKLPKQDGFSVLAAIKRQNHLRMIPVLMLTSTDDQSEINRCYELGASSYIVKPVQYDAFQARVKALGLFLEIVRLPQ